jgi:DinB family protein
MAETIEQYVARLSGLVAERDPLALMAETPGRLQALVSGASPAELRWTTASGRWTVTQIAAHMADAEIVGAWRFRTVLAQDGVPMQAYDQNAWASAFRYEDAPPAESVGLFGALRTATLRLLRRVDPARLRHAGTHAERGRESVEQLARMFAGHDLNHLAQIERLLGEARAAGA